MVVEAKARANNVPRTTRGMLYPRFCRILLHSFCLLSSPNDEGLSIARNPICLAASDSLGILLSIGRELLPRIGIASSLFVQECNDSAYPFVCLPQGNSSWRIFNHYLCTLHCCAILTLFLTHVQVRQNVSFDFSPLLE